MDNYEEKIEELKGIIDKNENFISELETKLADMTNAFEEIREIIKYQL